MPDSINGPNSAIATLLFHIGAAVEMHHAPDGSGAFSEYVPTALTNYFGYQGTAAIIYKGDYTTNDWLTILKAELNSGRPMYYAGDSAAYHEYDGNNTPDSWLISPAITLSANKDYVLSFYEKNNFFSWYVYSGVRMSDGNGNAGSNDFIELYESDADLPEYVLTEISIPSASQARTVFFAFVYSGYDAHEWWVDEQLV